jgi:hypothetical protein
MPKPVDQLLYDRVKHKIYKQNPKHSAYRSGKLVKEYKTAFVNMYGKSKSPYIGKKPKLTGLPRWFKEDWKSDTGKYRYTSKSSVYRPSHRVTEKTPTTFSELTPVQLRRAKTEKRKTGRVKKFKKIKL